VSHKCGIPCTIELRIDLQELWSAGYSWDEILPEGAQAFKSLECVTIMLEGGALRFGERKPRLS